MSRFRESPETPGDRGPLAPALTAAVLLALACSPRPPATEGSFEITPRGHAEVAVGADGVLTPMAIGREEPLGLCLRTGPSVDTSQWRARLWFEGSEPRPSVAESPVARMQTTVCFARPVSDVATGPALNLCGEVEDTFDGRRIDLGCRSFRFDPDARARARFVAGLGEVLSSPLEEGGVEARVAALDRLAERVGSAYPLLRIRLELVIVYFLRREATPASLAEARRRLDGLPPWLSRPAAAAWEAQAEQSRASLTLAAGGSLATAWRHLKLADAAYLRVADPNRFTVAMHRSEILGRVGATREAVERLESALDECRQTPCSERLLPPARGTLAWLILLDPLATQDDLSRAGAILDEALDGIDPERDPLEHANQRVNRAYLSVRMGRSPEDDLSRARELLEGAPEGGRRSQLEGWAELVAAEDDLAASRAEAALDRCRSLARSAAADRLLARALSCVGRARRQLGDLSGAAGAFDSALSLHEVATPAALNQRLVVGPGQQGEDYYRAARIAVERGDPAQAWRLLERLDRTTLAEEARTRCGETPGAGGSSDLGGDSRRRELLDELAALEQPASATRREQRRAIRRTLLAELQELSRTLRPDCPAVAEPPEDGALDYRAVALDDEILLLRRVAGVGVSVVRRSPMAHSRLVEIVREVRGMLDTGDADDAVWRAALEPVGAALTPETAPSGHASFALHGVLQGLPLAALPRSGNGWLADLATLALRPAGAAAARSGVGGRSLFVVDPVGNLPSGRRQAALYRRLFPAARVLEGGEATRAAIREASADARWIHFDTHGQYDPAFPELSRLSLADGSVDMVELGSWEAGVEMANLSGCDTGRWPATADSGRYGFAGLFCRRGASWVIASRAPLADGLASDLNGAFYRALARGGSVPEAYADALAAIRSEWPAAAWGSVLLLEGPGAPAGQSNAPVTPRGTGAGVDEEVSG